MEAIQKKFTKAKAGNYGTIISKIEEHPEVRKPFFIVILLALIQQFSGATVIRGYVVKIFGNVFLQSQTALLCNPNATINCECDSSYSLSQSANVAAILVAVVRLTSSLILTQLLVQFPRRRLYLMSGIGTLVSLVLFATTLLFSDGIYSVQVEIPIRYLHWLSVVSTCFIVFFSNLGIQPMPLLMSSELFPSDIRALCKV